MWTRHIFGVLASVGFLVGAVSAQNLQITQMVGDLDQPWGVEMTPTGEILITERDGHLLYVKDGVRQVVRGTPKVVAQGQGGLLDITLPRDFATSREVFLTYSKPQHRSGSGTALAVGRLSEDGTELTGVRDLFESAPGGRGGRHFGSRVVEAGDGTLFVTIGDRGDRPSAQDQSLHNGTIIRINRDGSVPTDNPFVGQPGVRAEIWSYGHRNPQGAGMDAQGTLWTAEHGARGGDEINRVEKGANYGWPIISYGVHYSGAKIGQGTAQEGLEQPQFYWDPSIAPSGLLIYSGKMWPRWRGQIFVGSLKFDYIARVGGAQLRELGQIKTDETLRVRDIIEASDGSIWFLSVGAGALYRISRR